MAKRIKPSGNNISRTTIAGNILQRRETRDRKLQVGVNAVVYLIYSMVEREARPKNDKNKQYHSYIQIYTDGAYNDVIVTIQACTERPND